MNVTRLLARAGEFDYRVELDSTGPRLVRLQGSALMPESLLKEFQEHRDEVIRYLTVSAILARAGEIGRRVYGYSSVDGRVTELHGSQAPEEWDRICVEGDREWVFLMCLE